MPDNVFHIPPHDVPSVSDWLEVIGRLKRQGHTRKRAAELLHGHPPPPTRWINDFYAIFAPALKDHKMRKLPMQDGPLIQIRQRLQLNAHAASTQSIVPRRLQKGPGRHTIALRAGHVAYVAQWDMLAIRCQDHDEAGGTAFRGRQLLNEWDLPRSALSGELAQRGEAFNERLGDSPSFPCLPSNTALRPGTSAKTRRSEWTRTSAVPCMPSW